MVVSQKLAANDTALPYKQQQMDPVPLKLDYDMVTTENRKNHTKPKCEDKDCETVEIAEIVEEKNITEDKKQSEEENIQILKQTEIIDEVITGQVREEEQPKTVNLPLTPGIETGLEIQFTSLKLVNFPICETNLLPNMVPVETLNLNSSNIKIGNFTLYNAGVKVYSYPGFKILEFKTREFKIGLSVGLHNEDTLKAEGEYFYYEIFNHLKNSRLLNIANIFKKIFSGEIISFEINNLKGEISFENRLQYHKFTIIENAVNIFHRISKKLRLSKNKNLSEAPISFYTLFLMDQYIHGKDRIDSWINFGIDNTHDIKAGDSVVFSKIHVLDMKGLNFDLKETIRLKQPITETELAHVKNRVTCYKKTVTIELEKIGKN